MIFTYGFWWRGVLYNSPKYIVLKKPLTQNHPYWKANNVNLHEALEYLMWENINLFSKQYT